VRSGRTTATLVLLGSLLWLLGACVAPIDQQGAGQQAGPATASPNQGSDPGLVSPAGEAPPAVATLARPAYPAAPRATRNYGTYGSPAERAPVMRPLAALPRSGIEVFPENLPEPLPDGLGDIVTETYTGLASWYGRRFHGRRTASGERYDMAALTAAHKTLPFGSRVRVTNLDNGRSVVVVINDRGPFVKARVIDLSHAAAAQLGFLQDGVAKVRIDVLADSRG